jgi:CRISPR-associated endonuclease Cas2
VKKSDEKKLFRYIKTVRKAGLSGNQLIRTQNAYPTDSVEKFNAVIQYFKKINHLKTNEMFCFIMYDIESNKVRNQVAKYLIRKGCIRVQKSVFAAHFKNDVFHKIADTLKEINDIYENEDSIFILPVNEDNINKLKIIGKDTDLEIITSPRNTLIV